jgi:hypothetical protein
MMIDRNEKGMTKVNKKRLRNALLTFVGAAFALAAVAAPVAVNANAKPAEATVTVKSYDMDEYLNMLLKTKQYEKYDTFKKIANKDAWEKHVQYQTWHQNNLWGVDYPVWAVMTAAEWLGFDADEDTFKLLSWKKDVAKVKVTHDKKDYVVTLQEISANKWRVLSTQRI